MYWRRVGIKPIWMVIRIVTKRRMGRWYPRYEWVRHHRAKGAMPVCCASRIVVVAMRWDGWGRVVVWLVVYVIRVIL